MKDSLASFLGKKFKPAHDSAWTIWCKIVEDLVIIGLEGAENDSQGEAEVGAGVEERKEGAAEGGGGGGYW